MRIRVRNQRNYHTKSAFLEVSLDDTRIMAKGLGVPQIGFHESSRILHQLLLPFTQFNPGLNQTSQYPDMLGQTQGLCAHPDIFFKLQAEIAIAFWIIEFGM